MGVGTFYLGLLYFSKKRTSGSKGIGPESVVAPAPFRLLALVRVPPGKFLIANWMYAVSMALKLVF